MEFAVNAVQYRVERGLSTGRWLLFENKGDRVQWRLIDAFPASIDDEDVMDRAKASIALSSYSRQES